jgi:hypothetical protein
MYPRQSDSVDETVHIVVHLLLVADFDERLAVIRLEVADGGRSETLTRT